MVAIRRKRTWCRPPGGGFIPHKLWELWLRGGYQPSIIQNARESHRAILVRKEIAKNATPGRHVVEELFYLLFIV